MSTPFIRSQDIGKNFDFSPWGGIEGFLKASQSGTTGNFTALKRIVPDLARAVDMTSTAISSLPFDVLDENGDVFDTSSDWQNKLGGIESPQRLLYLLASSLCGGEAYIIPTRTPRMIYELQYAAPHTITPQIRRDGLQYFDRVSDQGVVERYNPKDLIYFWLTDSDIEIGPAQNHPLGNAALDAQLVFNLKDTMRTYGERGFVPITLLGAKGMPGEDERKKAEGFFDKLLRNGFDVLAKVINADTLSLIRVGAGMDELKGSFLEIRRDAKESIADAFGIPFAMFASDNAYASEMQALRIQWYTSSRYVSLYQCIQDTLNAQLLKQYGKCWQFTPQSLDVFQVDEERRNASLVSFVNAVTSDADAADLGMSILGYDLTKEQQGKMDKLIKQKEENKKKLESQMQGRQPNGAPVGEEHEPQENEQETEALEDEKEKSVHLTAPMVTDIKTWSNMAIRFFKKGKPLPIDFECKALPENVSDGIRERLRGATDEIGIMKAFEINAARDLNSAALVLEGIRLAMTKL